VISLAFIDKPVIKGTEGFLVEDRFISLRIIYAVSFFISVTAYSVLTFIVINKHQRHLKKYLSYSSGKVTLQWLLGLSITFYVGYVIMFIFGGVDILVRFMPFDPYEISFIGLTILAFLFGVFGFNQSSIFEIASNTSMPVENSLQSKQEKKYQRSGLKKKNIQSHIDRITRYMEDEKPYLNRELTIYNVSEALDIPRHIISEIINEHMGKNFYTLINEYRVEEVKRRLQDPEFKNLTILAIAYESGFNSKSSFNTIFKESTGHTPSQYVKQATSRDS
jgi:AraC-like DNA-binding protein